MKARYLHFAGAVLCFLMGTEAYSQNPLDVHANLKLADPRVTYRIGEPIRLLLELTADRPGFVTDTIPDRTSPIEDRIIISPEAGTKRWLDEYLGGGRGFRDYFSTAPLSGTPTTIEVILNDSIRIDKPGHYSVRVTTSRLWPSSPSEQPNPHLVLTTNDVSFDVEAMSEADEEKEVKRISDLIEAARSWQAQEAAGRQLAYLTGDTSAREKVRRYLSANPQSSNYLQQLYYGLFIARNRALVRQLLEAALRDPSRPATTSLLHTVVSLRQLESGFPRRPSSFPLSPQEVDPATMQIYESYIRELAASLSKRSGQNLTTTAQTILISMPKDRHNSAEVVEAKRVLLANFDAVHPWDQEYLLRMYWDELGGPALIPALKKMLTVTGMASKNVHDSALQRLIAIAPDEARPFVIAELRDPKSLADFEILAKLPDKSLPEADAALAEQIRLYAPVRVNFDSVFLRQKSFLVARFASEAVYQDLMETYRNNVAKLPLDSRAALLAYFARYDEDQAVPLIEETLAAIKPGQIFNFLPDLTKLYFSDAIDRVVRKQLESEEPELVSNAAYVLSLHGPDEDRALIEARLARWRKEWGNRAADADTNNQGLAERELVIALTRTKRWTLSPDRARELQQSCITKSCKQNFQTR